MLKTYFGDRDFWSVTLRLALPIAFQNLLMSSLSLVDTLMVGQLGDVALSGVGMAGQWSWLLNLVLFGLSSGSAVFIAQFWGVGDIKKIHGIYGVMLLHSAAVAILFFLIGFIVPRGVVSLFNGTPAVVEAGSAYLRIVCFSYLGAAMSSSFSTLLRSTENVRLPMYAGLFSTILNAILNYGLIYGKMGLPEMGVRGAAVATCISAWSGPIIIYTVSLWKKTIVIAPLRDIFGFGRDLLMRFYKVSTPVILNESLWGLGTVCYNIIFGRLGYEHYAAITIYRTIEGIAFVFFIGLCNACCVMVGKSIGAGYLEKAYIDARRFTILVPVIAVFVGGAIILLRGPFIGLFNLSGSITQTTIESARGILFVYGAELFMRNIPYILIVGVFRSGGDTVTGMKYDLLLVWCVALPLTIISAFVLKLPFVAVFAVMLITEDTLKVILCLLRFKSKKWIRPLTDEGRAAVEYD
ncbi:MAG: MATE family efflux transporter [Eubacteriales bacterium]